MNQAMIKHKEQADPGNNAGSASGILARRNFLVREKFMEFFFPSVFMAMSASLSIIVDSMIVGNVLGSSELAAMNLIMPVSLCFTALTAIFGIGSSIDIALLKGKLDKEKADKCLSLSCIAWGILSIITICLGLTAVTPLSVFLSGTSGLELLVEEYLRIYLLGSPFTFITMIFPHIIRADGRPKLASNVLIIANAANLVLDIVFMKYMGMGLGGGALATICGYAIGSVLYLIYVFSRRRTLHLVRVRAADLHMYADMLRLSISSVLGQGLMFGKIWIFNMLLGSIAGQEGLTAFSVCTSCLSFASMFIAGAAQTMMPMVGAFRGAQDHTAVGMTVRFAFRADILCCTLTMLLFEFFPQAVLGLFGITGGAALEIGIAAVRRFSLALPGIGISFLFMYYMQAAKETVFSTQICVLEGFVIIVPVGILQAWLFGTDGFWFAYAINELLVIGFILLRVRGIVRKSDGKLYSVFMLKKPDGKNLELTVNISDESEKKEAARALEAFFGTGTAQGEPDKHAVPQRQTESPEDTVKQEQIRQLSKLWQMVSALSYAAYNEKGTKPGRMWLDITAEDERITFTDMAEAYALTVNAQDTFRELCDNTAFRTTQMIGMNYSVIQIGFEK